MSCCCFGVSSVGSRSDGEGSTSAKRDELLPASERKCTNVTWLVVHGIYLAVVLSLVVLCGITGDGDIIKKRYDICGNFCGRENLPDPKVPCKGIDHTSRPYLLKKKHHRECVSDCAIYGRQALLSRCVMTYSAEEHKLPSEYDEDDVFNFFDDVYLSIGEIAVCVILSVIFTLGIALLFLFFPKAMVWVCLFGSILVMGVVSTYAWIIYAFKKAVGSDSWRTALALGAAITYTVKFVCCLIILVLIRDKLSFVSTIYYEASHYLRKKSSIFFLTFLSIFVHAALIFIELIMFLTIISCQKSEKNQVHNSYDYKLTSYAAVTLVLFFPGCVWLHFFINDCVYFVMACTLSRWYFSRNKETVRGNVKDGFYILTRFHLGTICFGSLLLMFLGLLKIVVEEVNRRLRDTTDIILKTCGSCCTYFCDTLMVFLAFVTRTTYILTVIHGVPFCEAGKRNADLMGRNAGNVISVVYVTKLIMFLKVFILWGISFLFSYFLLSFVKEATSEVPSLVIVIVFIVPLCFLFCETYSNVIQILLVCFCEDVRMNDGLERPYYMSPELLDFVEKSRDYFTE